MGAEREAVVKSKVGLVCGGVLHTLSPSLSLLHLQAVFSTEDLPGSSKPDEPARFFCPMQKLSQGKGLQAARRGRRWGCQTGLCFPESRGKELVPPHLCCWTGPEAESTFATFWGWPNPGIFVYLGLCVPVVWGCTGMQPGPCEVLCVWWNVRAVL